VWLDGSWKFIPSHRPDLWALIFQPFDALADLLKLLSQQLSLLSQQLSLLLQGGQFLLWGC
jgi:hypothetical protein